MIDPQKTLVLAFEYGGHDENGRPRRLVLIPSAQQWIKQIFPGPESWTATGAPGIHEIRPNVWSVNLGPYLCARNGAIRDCVLPIAAERGIEWLLSIDNDVTVTHPGVDLFLETPGDVVACQCPMPSLHAWDTPTAFHTPLWRCRIEVLRAVRPPWFELVYSPDNCEFLECDCQYFAAKCRAAGFTVRHGGNCGHGNYGSAAWPNCHVALPLDPLTRQVPHGAVTQELLREGRLV